MDLFNYSFFSPENLLLFPLIILLFVVFYFFIFLMCVISISHKLGDIRDSLEKISKNSGN